MLASSFKNSARAFVAVKPLAYGQIRLQSSSAGIKQLSSLPDFDAAVKKDNISLVDFFATWCGPCKMIAPHLQKLSEKYPAVSFYKVDVDESPDIAGALSVSAMPTFILFKEGKALGKIVGADPRGIEEAIKHFSKSSA